MDHVSAEELSALLDRELSPQAELRARQHLAECVSCSADYALAVRLDDELRQPPVLACEEVLEVLSAGLDRETSEGEQAAAQRHLADCPDCPASVHTWTAFTAGIKALPVIAPSARIDDAIYAIARSPRTYRPAAVRGVAARALIAITAVFAIVVASLGTGARPQTAVLPSPTADRAIVASIQQIVFNSRNNTLYVLDAPGAAVDARDPATNYLKTRIEVGGEPTALALNISANTILVLDPSQKRVTEIDAASNKVIGATTVAVTGTPTSIGVDSSGSKILVTTVAASSSGGSAPAGAVAVIDNGTKQLETVRETNVAPRLVVLDQRGGRIALIGSDATSLVDSSYRVLATLPGGVGAAFSSRGDSFAILSAAGADSQITFTGGGTPQSIRLAGTPRAIISLPDGSYLVFVASGGVGHVTKIARDGTIAGSVEVAPTSGDLVFDGTSNRFVIANAGRVDSGEIPAQVAIAATPTAPPSGPAASASAPPSASPSGSPEATPVRAPGSTVIPTFAPRIVERAQLVSGGLYTLPLPAEVEPQLTATLGSRVWILDQANGVSYFDLNTADTFTIGRLRTEARVSFWVAGGTYLYGVDVTHGELHVINTVLERIDTYATTVVNKVSAVAVGIDGRLWIGLPNASYLMTFDPRSRQFQAFDLGGARVSALTVDALGRILYADDAHGTVGLFDAKAARLNEVLFARTGSTTSLFVDSTSTLWVGTSTGEIYAVRGGTGRLTLSLGRPVTAFAPDQAGRAWYLAPLPAGVGGFAYAPADGSRAPSSVRGPVLSLAFNPLGRAFLADPRGAFYMSIEGGR